MRTAVTCPACHHPFTAMVEDGTTVVFCASPNCPSAAAYDGKKTTDKTTPDKLAAGLRQDLLDMKDW